jgi:hypothetical protein
MVIRSLPVAVLSAVEVAVIVTVAGFGTDDGGV